MSKVFAYVFAGSTEPGEIYASFIIPPYLKMTTEYAEKKNLILVGIKLPNLEGNFVVPY